jgi:hypothetical protein
MDRQGLAAEQYLRLMVETALDPYRAGPDPVTEVEGAAGALAAVGVADPELTAELLAGLRLALAIRRGPPWPLPSLAPPPHPGAGPPPASPRAVAVGPARFQLPTGAIVVEAVTLGSDGGTVVASVTDEQGGRGGRPGRPAPVWGPPRRPAGRRGRPTPPAVGPPAPPHPAGGLPHHAAPAPHPSRASGDERLDQLRLMDAAGRTSSLGPGARVPVGPGLWRTARPARGPLEAFSPWVDLVLAGRGVVRLPIQPARPPLAGREHRRSPGAAWVAAAVGRAATGLPAAPVTAGVRALLAVGALDPGDPLARQAAIVAGKVLGEGLDPRWRSAVERRDAPAVVQGSWPVGAFVDLGSERTRLDSLHAGGDGAWLAGWCGPWSAPAPPVSLSAFDDRHNWYLLDPAWRLDATAGWRLRPELDPEARSLRVDVMGREREASVEIALR